MIIIENKNQTAVQTSASSTTMSVANNDTEQMSAIMDKLIADAVKAESQRDAALARVAELEERIREIAGWSVPPDDTKRFCYQKGFSFIGVMFPLPSSFLFPAKIVFYEYFLKCILYASIPFWKRMI